jgi:hypothetical protein
MALSREFYIKKGAMKIAPKDLPVVFYVENRENDNTARECAAMCFIGKRSKPAWYYGFRSRAQMEQKIKEQIEGVQASEDRKAKEKAERSKPHSLQVGDILVSSWGYDQTNVDFYKVKRLVGKSMVELIAVGSNTVEGSDYDHGMACEVVAVPQAEYGEPFKKKASSNNYVRLNSFSGASKWDGSPMYKSWYA